MQFRSVIQIHGLNPYMDIPRDAEDSLASHSVHGRVRVRGTLNGAPIQATLVPTGGPIRRLYVNGGMRAAAKVGVGDSVVLNLEPVPYDEVFVPDDLAAALRATQGAQEVFATFSPARRSEWMRFIEDARTPQSRAKRIQRTVASVTGKSSKRSELKRERPLWTCPDCGNEFVNRNQYHSCARHSVDNPFEGKPATVREIFDRLRDRIEECGPVKLVPYRDRIGFMVRVRFAIAVPKTRWVDLSLWLRNRRESPRFRCVETLAPEAHVHTLRLTEPGQLDQDVLAWLREAYRVGKQERD